MNQYQERTNLKLDYAKIHLEELKNYPNASSNDIWENAHEESCFYHLAGAVEALLHEINEGYSLGLALNKVDWSKVEKKLQLNKRVSAGFDYLIQLKNNTNSWFALLLEFRNHGAHRTQIGKIINLSNWQDLDNEFTDPRTNMRQTIYPGLGCLDVLKKLTDEVENLIDHCRKIDPNL